MRSTSTKQKNNKFSNPSKLPKINQKPTRPVFQINNKILNVKPAKKKQVTNYRKSTIPLPIVSKPSSNSSIKSPSNIRQALISIPSNNISKENIAPKQEIIIKPPPSFPQLTWDDFQGAPIENSWFLAQIYWGISYTTKVKETNSSFKVEVNPHCYINRARSWVKTEYENLLEHEQGHFNIGHLCALTFKKRVLFTRFDQKNYKQEVQKMFDETMREFCEMERRYDKETCHMLDTDMQMKWEEDLMENLKELTS
jgi:hypothetical protein